MKCKFHSIQIFSALKLFLIVVEASNVFWGLSTKPAYFRSTVKLFCNISSAPNCCTDKIRLWNGGQTQETITLNEKSFFPSKYASEIVPGGFSLEIKDFSASDVNIPYTCSYGVYQQKRILGLDENFISYPNVHLLNSSDNNVVFIASLSRVYPSPNCSASNNGDAISSELSVVSSNEDVFFNANVTLNKTDLQCGSLLVSCAVGKEEIIVLNTTVDKCSRTKDIPDHTFPVGAAISALFIFAMVVVFIYLFKSWQKRKHYRKQTHEQASDEIALDE